jgi:hydroxyacylglutathione hydrolase
MQVTQHIHALRIPFQVAAPGGAPLDRFAYVYLVYGQTLCLIDTGVAGAEEAILDYVRGTGRKPEEIELLVLTHSHPDHVGAARAVRSATGCAVAAHGAERAWIEDVDRQARERPVPGFHALVGGSVPVDRVLEEGSTVDLGGGLTLEALHTRGHSAGSISLRLPADGALITGDAVPIPGDMPIYMDAAASRESVRRLRALAGIETLLSSWDEPRRGAAAYGAMDGALAWLDAIDAAVRRLAEGGSTEPMSLCARVVAALGLPPSAANPLVARSFMANLREAEGG